MTKLSLSCGDSIVVECACEPKPVVVRSSDGIENQVDIFAATDGMHCPRVAVKRNHSDEEILATFNAAYPGIDDEGAVCIVISSEFPDIKVRVRPDRAGGTPVAMPEDFTVLDFRGDNFYIHLDSVLAAFSAEQLKAAMTPTMRTALGAILP